MFIKFGNLFLRKYSCFPTLGFIKHRGFFVTELFCKHSSVINDHGTLSLFRKLYSSGNFSNKVTILGNSRIPTCWRCCNHGTLRFQRHVACWVLSRQNNWGQFSRNFSSSRNPYQKRNRTTAIYTIALAIVVLGASYAAVPLYRIFCQVIGLWSL